MNLGPLGNEPWRNRDPLRCEILPARRPRFIGPAVIALTAALLLVLGIRVAVQRACSRLDASILAYPLPTRGPR